MRILLCFPYSSGFFLVFDVFSCSIRTELEHFMLISWMFRYIQEERFVLLWSRILLSLGSKAFAIITCMCLFMKVLCLLVGKPCVCFKHLHCCPTLGKMLPSSCIWWTQDKVYPKGKIEMAGKSDIWMISNLTVLNQGLMSAYVFCVK